MFKVDAHKWIDHVGKLGRDAIIAESLDAASRGSGESTVIHRTIQDRFRTLIPDLASGGIDSIVAIDTKGRVIARVGDNEKEYGDFIGGAEIIADALRGYLSDDVWGVNGRLQRAGGGAGAVEEPRPDRRRRVRGRRDRPGAGRAPEEEPRRRHRAVAAREGDRVVARRRASWTPARADRRSHTKEIETAKRTPADRDDGGQARPDRGRGAVPGPGGRAAGVLRADRPAPGDSGFTALFANATSDDLKWGQFPWMPLVGAVLAMILIGLFLQRLEIESPLARLRRELQKLASGDIHKIEDTRYGGNVGGLARDVNAAIERFTHAPTQRSDIAGKDLNAILGPSGGSTFDLPAADSAFGGAAPAFSPPPPPRSRARHRRRPRRRTAPPLPSFAPPPAPTFPAPQPFNASSLGFGGGSSAASPAASDLPLPGTTKPSPWGSRPRIPRSTADPPEQPPPDGDATRVVPYDPDEEEEAHFRHIFDDFIAKKRDCGESTVGLTRDKFLQKLRDNKASLVAKHHCRTVRFSVYIKDGKAALKATPVRE